MVFLLFSHQLCGARLIVKQGLLQGLYSYLRGSVKPPEPLISGYYVLNYTKLEFEIAKNI
jgi:hypothetical protein